MNPNCIERRDSTVAPQALYLMNNAVIDQVAAHLAFRVHHEAGVNAAKQIDRAYLIALSRPPSEEEKRIGLEALRALTEKWANTYKNTAAYQALVTYCHALLNSAGFLYVD
jgi:Protein of unknown function (DUF1553)